MKCPYCKHIIRSKDEICKNCGKLYPRMRITKMKYECEKCGSHKIIMVEDK